ncbi:UNVERIFIED_CONTAM: hypothetical protein K2H54_003583 [Gekko kuhli]
MVDMATVQAAKAENWPQQDRTVNGAACVGDPVVIRSIKGRPQQTERQSRVLARGSASDGRRAEWRATTGSGACYTTAALALLAEDYSERLPELSSVSDVFTCSRGGSETSQEATAAEQPLGHSDPPSSSSPRNRHANRLHV